MSWRRSQPPHPNFSGWQYPPDEYPPVSSPGSAEARPAYDYDDDRPWSYQPTRGGRAERRRAPVEPIPYTGMSPPYSPSRRYRGRAEGPGRVGANEGRGRRTSSDNRHESRATSSRPGSNKSRTGVHFTITFTTTAIVRLKKEVEEEIRGACRAYDGRYDMTFFLDLICESLQSRVTLPNHEATIPTIMRRRKRYSSRGRAKEWLVVRKEAVAGPWHTLSPTECLRCWELSFHSDAYTTKQPWCQQLEADWVILSYFFSLFDVALDRTGHPAYTKTTIGFAPSYTDPDGWTVSELKRVSKGIVRYHDQINAWNSAAGGEDKRPRKWRARGQAILCPVKDGARWLREAHKTRDFDWLFRYMDRCTTTAELSCLLNEGDSERYAFILGRIGSRYKGERGDLDENKPHKGEILFQRLPLMDDARHALHCICALVGFFVHCLDGKMTTRPSGEDDKMLWMSIAEAAGGIEHGPTPSHRRAANLRDFLETEYMRPHPGAGRGS